MLKVHRGHQAWAGSPGAPRLLSCGFAPGVCLQACVLITSFPVLSVGVKYVISQLSNLNSTAGATVAAAPNMPVLPVTPHQGDNAGQTLQSGFPRMLPSPSASLLPPSQARGHRKRHVPHMLTW